MTPAPSPDGRRILRVALIVGLLVRMVILSQTSTLTTRIVDEQHYAQLAASILRGDGFAWDRDHPTSVRPPLYPAFVAGIWSLAGAGNLQAARWVQMALALWTTLLVYQLGKRAFEPVAARYAAAIFWLYPSLIFFNFTLLTETLFTFLLVGFLLFSVRLVQTGRSSDAAVCGVVLGLAALTRSVLWPLPLILCPLLAVLVDGPLRKRILLPTVLAVAYLAVITPWAVRNTRLQGVVTIVDTMSGLNLRMGNYEHTPDDRMWAAVDLEGRKNWSYALTQDHPGEALTEGQKDKWAQRKALAYMRANPGTTLRRFLIKFADFWGLEREFAAGDLQGLYVPPRWFALLASAIIVIAYVLVVTLGGVGMWFAAPGFRVHVLLLLPVFLIAAAHTIVFGHSRYHVPLVPIFAVYAGALLASRGGVAWNQRRAATLGAACLIAVLMIIWVRQLVVVDATLVRSFLSLER